MRCRACGMLLRAMIGYAPPSWFRPKPRDPEADMVALTLSDRILIRPEPGAKRANPGDRQRIERQLESEAENLQREVRQAAVRNADTAKQSMQVIRQSKSYEQRARETLRDLMAGMAKSDVRRD